MSTTEEQKPSKVFMLAAEVVHEENVYTSLTFKSRPKAHMFVECPLDRDGWTHRHHALFLARLCGVPLEVIAGMLKSDFDALLKEAQDDMFDKPLHLVDGKQTMPYVMPLGLPFKLGTQFYEELKFEHLPLAGLMFDLPIQQNLQVLGHYYAIIASMTGVPTTVIRELAPTDAFSAVGVAMSFLSQKGPSLKTSGTDSV